MNDMNDYEKLSEACRKDGQKIERLIRRFYSQLDQRDVLFDGGAHEGYHTSFARGFYNLVVSVEASPKTYIKHIRNQQSLRGSNCPVIPLNAALGNRELQGETVNFFFSEAHPGRSTVNRQLWDEWAKGEVQYEAPITAPVIELDDIKALFASERTVNFVKLDLEGNEMKTLRGARKLMQADRPAIVMEYGLRPHNENLYGETVDGFRAWMQEQGYVLVAPWAQRTGQHYAFWYVFALPEGAMLERQMTLLRSCYEQTMQEPVAS